jgi:hypothetical protein
MWPGADCPSVRAIQADALFVSGLQRCEEPSVDQVRQAVAAAICAFGCSGCAGRVAQEFGDHPKTAVVRMRWARAVTREAFADSAPEPGPVGGAHAFRGAGIVLRCPNCDNALVKIVEGGIRRWIGFGGMRTLELTV